MEVLNNNMKRKKLILTLNNLADHSNIAIDNFKAKCLHLKQFVDKFDLQSNDQVDMDQAYYLRKFLCDICEKYENQRVSPQDSLLDLLRTAKHVISDFDRMLVGYEIDIESDQRRTDTPQTTEVVDGIKTKQTEADTLETASAANECSTNGNNSRQSSSGGARPKKPDKPHHLQSSHSKEGVPESNLKGELFDANYPVVSSTDQDRGAEKARSETNEKKNVYSADPLQQTRGIVMRGNVGVNATPLSGKTRDSQSSEETFERDESLPDHTKEPKDWQPAGNTCEEGHPENGSLEEQSPQTEKCDESGENLSPKTNLSKDDVDNKSMDEGSSYSESDSGPPDSGEKILEYAGADTAISDAENGELGYPQAYPKREAESHEKTDIKPVVIMTAQTYRKSFKDIESELHSIKKHLAAVQQDRDHLKERLKENGEQHRLSLQEKDKQLATNKIEFATLTQELEDLKAESKEKEEKHRLLLQEKDEQFAAKEKEFETLKHEQEDLKAVWTQKQQEATMSLQEKEEKWKEESNKLISEKQTLLEKLKEIEEQHRLLLQEKDEQFAAKEKEFATLKHELEDLKAEWTKKQQEATMSLQDKEEKWEEERNKLNTQISEKQTLLEKLTKTQQEATLAMQKKEDEWREQNNNLNTQLSQMQEMLQKETQELKQQLEKSNKEKQSYIERLSKEMGAKISADESQLENISVRNRPMTVAEDYQQFMANVWTDAKQELDDHMGSMGETEKYELLNDMLQSSHKAVKTLFTKCEEDIFAKLATLTSQTESSDTPSDSEYQFSTSVKNHVGDLLRMMSGEVNVESVVQPVLTGINKQRKQKRLKKIPENELIRNYVSEAAALAWKMIVQRPPMSYEMAGIGAKHDPKTQTLHYSSGDPESPGAVVQLYVFPSLYHGKGLMVKGTVIL